MLWEAGPRVCLCISLRPTKRRRRARWSYCVAKCTGRPHLTAGAQTTKGLWKRIGFYSLYTLFFLHQVFEMINISSGQREKNQSNPAGLGCCLRLSAWVACVRARFSSCVLTWCARNPCCSSGRHFKKHTMPDIEVYCIIWRVCARRPAVVWVIDYTSA